MRWWLALRCFFRVLRGRALPADPRLLLPAAGAAPPAAPADRQAEAPATGRAAGAVELLRLLQREGRLVDFLWEDIDAYTDEQVGAAVRGVHRGCRRVLERYLALQPVIDGEEGAMVTIEQGFDPRAIELTGEVRGVPPFRGTLRHPGWRASRIELPELPGGACGIVAPAEVEIG
ncbi:MAG: hypothetical protein KatS3mg102_0074 [Planctomycetota bacterium]|nr:MAG: hypothetical protein KatS3mg102_0074 [Planctomycetota bacterium]